MSTTSSPIIVSGRMVELVDTPVLGTGAERHGGSTPSIRTKYYVWSKRFISDKRKKGKGKTPIDKRLNVLLPILEQYPHSIIEYSH